MISEHQKALCLALVHKHVKEHESYRSWVPEYSAIRESAPQSLMGYMYTMQVKHHAILIAGHYRQKAMYRKMLKALKCTCKFEAL